LTPAAIQLNSRDDEHSTRAEQSERKNRRTRCKRLLSVNHAQFVLFFWRVCNPYPYIAYIAQHTECEGNYWFGIQSMQVVSSEAAFLCTHAVRTATSHPFDSTQWSVNKNCCHVAFHSELNDFCKPTTIKSRASSLSILCLTQDLACEEHENRCREQSIHCQLPQCAVATLPNVCQFLLHNTRFQVKVA